MLTAAQYTKIYDENAVYYGYPLEKLMEKAGEGIARKILKKYGRDKRIAFFCGLGNNGGDGLVAARYLENKADITVYLIATSDQIKTAESQKNWELFQGKKFTQIKADQISNDFDIVVDCLLGTGIIGKLREPYRSIITRLNQLNAQKVAIDVPTSGFQADFIISMMFSKVAGATVVDIDYPDQLRNRTGIGEIKVLNFIKADSYKGENGKLLIMGGSKKYHGAPILAAQIASRIVDLVYICSTAENNKIIQKMKSELAEFIAIPMEDILRNPEQTKRVEGSFEKEKIMNLIEKVDTILIGPGLDESGENEKLINGLLQNYPEQKFILDAGALHLLNKKLLGPNCILTPHKQEFKTLFNCDASFENTRKMAQKFNCIIVLKGKADIVASATDWKINHTGNAGMTKGGTGDVLAGLIAALACRNDLFLAACAGVFACGLAGDKLQEKVDKYFNASDLIAQIPEILAQH